MTDNTYMGNAIRAAEERSTRSDVRILVPAALLALLVLAATAEADPAPQEAKTVACWMGCPWNSGGSRYG